jgi:Fur family ferric uptake transcriptional regulator
VEVGQSHRAALRDKSLARGLKQQWRTYLSTKRLKTTQTREAIVDAMLRSEGHISLEQLLRAARKQSPTVYRTVKLLEDAGLAASRQFAVGQTLYEVVGHHHDHIICQHCGFIVEFESEDIERLQTQIAAERGFHLVYHRHELFGQCDKARGLPGGHCPAEARVAKPKK